MSNLDAATVNDIPTWADVFRELDQWDAVETFAERHAQALDTRAGIRGFCSPKIGHLLAHNCRGFQIIHHVHQDSADDIDDEGNIWVLMGAGGTAATVVLSSTWTYNKQTGVSYEWSTIVHWTEIKDVAMTHPQATRFLGNAKGKAKGKGGAKGKKSKKGRPKDYDEDLFSSSKDAEEGVGAAIPLPNVLPLPGFLVAALMDAYTTDAGILCLAAIAAIRKRTSEAGVDPSDLPAAQKAAYVQIWIWNHATERARVPPGCAKGVGTSIAVSQRADLRASGVHKRYLHLTSSGSAAQTSLWPQGTALRGVDTVGADVWKNLANALAIQAASRGPATTGPKKGFEAFPVTTQQMILFASERDETGSARSAPVGTFTEILELTNAAYVAQHLHHHLKSRMGLDVLLPSGFCSAVRMASFISTTNDRPEAFRLFSCGPSSRWTRRPRRV